MESKVKLFGHPVHQMLVLIPFGLLAVSALLDIAAVVTGRTGLSTVTYVDIAAGLVGGLVAAGFGLADWSGIRKGTRARRVGIVHAGANVLALALFGISLALRYHAPGFVPGTAPLVLEIVGVISASVAGWLGGELVDRFGVGTRGGGHPDRSSSLAKVRVRTRPRR